MIVVSTDKKPRQRGAFFMARRIVAVAEGVPGCALAGQCIREEGEEGESGSEGSGRPVRAQ